jgi:NO-binding membrane sensor protein with MHYT domain
MLWRLVEEAGMEKHYDLWLVAYSFVIATLTGYCGIEMTSRVRRAAQADKLRWVIGAAFGFGTGVWAMHFMGREAWAPSEGCYFSGRKSSTTTSCAGTSGMRASRRRE